MDIIFSIFTHLAFLYIPQVAPTIYLTATAQQKTFYSHNGYDGITHYPSNYTRDWLISSSLQNYTITLTFQQCVLETGNGKGICIQEYIYIYDGEDENATLIQMTCCGLQHQTTMESSGMDIYVLFTTDQSIAEIGFSMIYYLDGVPTTTMTETTELTVPVPQMQQSMANNEKKEDYTMIIVGLFTALIIVGVLVLIVLVCKKHKKRSKKTDSAVVDYVKPKPNDEAPVYIRSDSFNSGMKASEMKLSTPPMEHRLIIKEKTDATNGIITDHVKSRTGLDSSVHGQTKTNNLKYEVVNNDENKKKVKKFSNLTENANDEKCLPATHQAVEESEDVINDQLTTSPVSETDIYNVDDDFSMINKNGRPNTDNRSFEKWSRYSKSEDGLKYSKSQSDGSLPPVESTEKSLTRSNTPGIRKLPPSKFPLLVNAKSKRA